MLLYYQIFPDPFYYNNVGRYSGWANTTPDYVQSPEQSMQENNQIEGSNPAEPYTFTYYDNVYSPPVQVLANDRSLCSTPLTPQSPPVEIYPPYFAPTPSITPVIYTPSEITEILIPSPHVPVYSPTIEMSYLSPSPYIYPPTPPPAWYPPAINSQGFIFPAPVTTQNVSNRL